MGDRLEVLEAHVRERVEADGVELAADKPDLEATELGECRGHDHEPARLEVPRSPREHAGVSLAEQVAAIHGAPAARSTCARTWSA